MNAGAQAQGPSGGDAGTYVDTWRDRLEGMEEPAIWGSELETPGDGQALLQQWAQHVATGSLHALVQALNVEGEQVRRNSRMVRDGDDTQIHESLKAETQRPGGQAVRGALGRAMRRSIGLGDRLVAPWRGAWGHRRKMLAPAHAEAQEIVDAWEEEEDRLTALATIHGGSTGENEQEKTLRQVITVVREAQEGAWEIVRAEDGREEPMRAIARAADNRLFVLMAEARVSQRTRAIAGMALAVREVLVDEGPKCEEILEALRASKAPQSVEALVEALDAGIARGERALQRLREECIEHGRARNLADDALRGGESLHEDAAEAL